MAHGITVIQAATSVSTPNVAESGIPFVIGASPVQSAQKPVSAGVPTICTSWDEAVEKLGYSDDWANYPLCEFMYSHFKYFSCQPVIFCNLLDPSTMKSAVAVASFDVSGHQVKLPIAAIASSVVVKDSAGTTTYTAGTDYDLFYSGEYLIVDLLSTGSAYSDTALKISYDAATPASVTTSVVATGMDKIDLCLTSLGLIPDLICAPGYSQNSSVAAAMAAKAASLSGLCTAKALIDIDSSSATDYAAAVTAKGTNGFTAAEEIVCWPLAKVGTQYFHMSTIIAGLIARTDTENGGIPYESPSNKSLPIDGICLADGSHTAVVLTLAQANILNAGGIMTCLNFMGGWVAWGNYTGAFPGSTDVKDYFIPVSRMFSWVGNSLIKTFWSKLDRPMTRRLIDEILDSCNIWLNGLVGSGYLLGARVEMIDGENPTTALMAGIVKLHVYITPPSPMQELDFVLEYDASYVEAAFA